MLRALRRSRGFTLLEVMVAIAILALSLTAIFSSEAGAVRMASRARRSGVASLLARCKMAELEEQVEEEGFPALLDQGSDDCCEEGEVDGYTCDWEIAPIVLPETMFAPEEGDTMEAAPEAPGGQDPNSPLSQLSALTGGGADPSQLDPSAMLSGGGTDGLAAMAMGFVFPVLKPAFESQIRRATVIVHWREGSVSHEMDVTQYMVSPTAIASVDPNDPNAQVPGGGTPGAPAAPATGGGTSQ